MVDIHSTANGQDDPDRSVNISGETAGLFDDDRSAHTSLGTALAYAARGWWVFPCYADGERRKQPVTRHGVKDATSDPAKIRSMWTRGGWFPPGKYLVGVATGETSGVAILDIDVKRADANGFETLATLGYQDRIPTLTARTASGGMHLYFVHPPQGIRNTVGANGSGIGPGLDWRGDGGYVIAPSPGSGYEWLAGTVDLPLAEIPHALMPKEPELRHGPIASHGASNFIFRRADVAEILSFINPDAEYPVWRDVGAGLRTVRLIDGDEDDLRELFHQFSQGDFDKQRRGLPSRYSDEKAVDRIFDSMPPKEGGITFATVIKLAREAGFDGEIEIDEEAISAEPLVAWKEEMARRQSNGGRQSGCAVASTPAEPWPEPVDFLDDATPLPALTPDMLPPVIAEFASDEATRLGCDDALVGFPCLIICAAAIPDWVKLQPRERNSKWLESPRLWGGPIMAPGGGKTPALKAAIAPLEEIASAWRMNYDVELKAYKAALKQAKEDKKDGQTVEPVSAPIDRRCVSTDTTPEALAHVLAYNPQGVLIYRDELSGLIASFDAYRTKGHGKDRAAYLELWDGGQHWIDRRSEGGSIFVPNWSACLLGGIQPGKIDKLVQQGALEDDGFLQRFLMFAAERTGRGVDREPNKAAIDRYYAVVWQLTKFEDPCRPVTLSRGARDYFTKIEDEADRLRTQPAVSGALASFASKLPSHFARLLLTCHCIDVASGDAGDDVLVVSAETARRAYRLMTQFLIPHALRLYDRWFAGNGTPLGDVRRVAKFLLARSVERMTFRDLYKAFHEDKDKGGWIRDATEDLAKLNWVRADGAPRHDSESWIVNPVVHERFTVHATRERQRRQMVHEAIVAAGRERRHGDDEQS